MLTVGGTAGPKAAALKSLEVGPHLYSGTRSCGSDGGQPGRFRVPTIAGVGLRSSSVHI